MLVSGRITTERRISIPYSLSCRPSASYQGSAHHSLVLLNSMHFAIGLV